MAQKISFVFLAAICFNLANGLEIVMSGRDLPSMDIFDGAPDAYLNLYYAATPTSQYSFVGSTDNISNNRNPDWPESFRFDYNSSSSQMIKFDMYDADSPDADDYMGYTEITLNELIYSSDGIVEKSLIGGEPGGGRLIIKLKSMKMK